MTRTIFSQVGISSIIAHFKANIQSSRLGHDQHAWMWKTQMGAASPRCNFSLSEGLGMNEHIYQIVS